MKPLKRLRLVAAIGGALALVLLVRLAVFTLDSSHTRFSLFPGSERETRHSCVSAYFVAAQAAGEGREIYDEALYSLPGDPARPRVPRTLGIFQVDVYEYPPPFLLLPRALQRLAPDFERFRFAWFVLNVAAGARLVHSAADDGGGNRAGGAPRAGQGGGAARGSPRRSGGLTAIRAQGPDVKIFQAVLDDRA